jgi:hypothetical protein
MRPLMKIGLLVTLAGRVCPICKGEKIPQAWTCFPCGKGHRQSPEHDVLVKACGALMTAAHHYLKMIREARA